MRRRSVGATLVAFAFSVAAPLHAETVDDTTRNAARSLASQGKEALDGADFDRARDLFHRAYALVPAPTLAYYEGKALLRLGRLVEAEEALLRASRTTLEADAPEAFRDAVRDAEAELVSLRARMPHVTFMVLGIEATDPRLSVTLDERPLNKALLGVEVPIDPGQHVLRAAIGDGAPAQAAFSVAEKQSQRVELRPLEPRPAAASKPVEVRAEASGAPERGARAPLRTWQKPAALALGGVGVAGLVTGIVSGVMAGSRYASAEQACPQRACPQGSAGWDDVQSFRSLRTLSTVSYVIGGVGLAGGATLFLLAPSQPAAPKAAALNLWLRPLSVGVGGAF